MRGWWTRLTGPTVAFVVGLLMTRHAWGPQPPSGDDSMAVIVRAGEGLRILARGQLDGWSPRDGVGYPRFLHYGPGLSLAVGAVKVATLGLISTTAAVSLLYVLSFAAVAPAVWFLARSLGMRPRASTLSAVAALAVNNPFGVGLAGLYTIGLLPHALAAPLVFVGLGAAVRIVRDPTDRRFVVVLATVIGVVTFTHSISTIVLGFCIAAFVPLAYLATPDRRRPVPRVVALAIGGATGIALSAFWLLPALATLSERGVVATWSTPTLSSRVDEIINGKFLFGHYLALFVVAGWAWALIAARRGRPLIAIAPVVGVLFLVFAHWYFVHPGGSEVKLLLANRGVGYAGVLAIIPLGGLIDDLLPDTSPQLAGLVLGVGATVIVCVAVPGKPGILALPHHQPKAVDAMSAVAATLRDVVPDSGRFAFERDAGAEKALTGVTHPDYWLAAVSGRNNLNIYGIDQTPAAGVDDAAGRLKEDTEGKITADEFARYGVTHIVTIDPPTRARLEATNQFKAIEVSDSFAVLKVIAPRNQPRADRMLHVESGRASAVIRSVSRDNGKVRLAVRASQNTTATAPLGWSSGWHVRVDGKRVETSKTSDGLLSYQLPRGRHDVAIDYVPSGLGYIGLIVGVLAAAALFVWARGGSAARDRRDDRERLTGDDRSIEPVEEPDVLLREEHVHEAP